MKILHIIPSISPLRGGPSQAVLEMVWALRQQGIDAEIATTNDHGDDQLQVPLNQLIDYPLASPSTHLPDLAHPDLAIQTATIQPSGVTSTTKTVPVRFFARFSPKLTAVRDFAISLSLTTWLWQNIRHYDCLHIHAIFSYPSTMAMAIARACHVPYIVRPLGQLCYWSLQQSKTKKQHYLNWIESKNLQQAQAIHFTSLQEQQEASNLALSAPSFVLPHGLTPHQKIVRAKAHLQEWLDLPGEQPIVLFLSRLHPKKGLEALISALGDLTEYPFQLVIAGNGESTYQQQIQQQLQAANLLERTHMVGFVTGERKQLLLQGADLFALPSHSENFGIAVLEAMAAGLPTLITPEVALAPIIQQNQLGWVVDQNPQAIAFAICNFLQQPQASQAMGARAASIAATQFSWEQVAQQLIEQYHKPPILSVEQWQKIRYINPATI